jgi:hypothetical protein
MKNDEKIKDDLYAYVSTSALMTDQTKKVNGVLRKTLRPLDSENEDVVISILANQYGQVQESFINVNVYVKDVLRDGQYEENTARLRTLCDLCYEVFEHHCGTDYDFWLDTQRVFPVDGKHEHFINNKLLYKTINE